MKSDTIYAVSTAMGKSAVAVIRVSGPKTDAILSRLCEPTKFVARRATLSRIFDVDGKLLDRGLVIKFDAPKSFTGEAMAEFQITGGRAIIRGLLRVLSTFPGTRPAEAGEFALRAFQNRKLDLVEVEGLADLVDAETSMQLRQAHALASGELSRTCEDMRTILLGCMATIEAMLDFSDVEDADELTVDSVLPRVAEVIGRLERLLENSQVSERLREGMSVVIAGPPNVGKSTLLNCLAKRDVAIVSPVAGTTRDAIEVSLDIEGFPVLLTDTAGIRPTDDLVEHEGIARTRAKTATADLVLWLSDEGGVIPVEESFGCPVLKIRTKADLNPVEIDVGVTVSLSAKTGENIGQLIAVLTDFARKHFAGAGSVVVATHRQRGAVRDVIEPLSAIIAEPHRASELIAEDLRIAANALGRVTGRVDVEEVLGEIFSRLCVGK